MHDLIALACHSCDYNDNSEYGSLQQNTETSTDGPGEQTIDISRLCDDLLLAVIAFYLPWYISQAEWHNHNLCDYTHTKEKWQAVINTR